MAGRRIGAILDSDQKKFTEPVALSSPEPVGFPLPRTAPRPGFDLLVLGASGTLRGRQSRFKRAKNGKDAICTFSVLTLAGKRFVLLALNAWTKKIRRAGCAFVPRTG